MVGYYAHGDILLFVFTVFNSRHFGNGLDHRLEYIRIVIGGFSLQCHTQTFETHTCIDYFCRKRFETAIRFAVVLHEYEIPYFDYLRMIVVYEIATGNFCTFFDMDFRARTARTGITHFPEVIMLVSIDDVIFRQELFPIRSCLIVALQSFFGAAFEYGGIQVFRV